MKFKVHIIYIGVILILLTLWNFHVKYKNNQITNIVTENSYKDVKLDSLKNKNGELVYQQEILYTNSQKTIKELTDSLHLKFNNIQFINHTETVTIIDSVLVPYLVESSPQEKKDSCVKVGKPFKLDSTWYSISGTVQLKGVVIDSLFLNDEEYLVISTKKSGFLKQKRTNIVTIQHKNPHVHVTKSQTLQYKDKPLLNKWVIPIGSAIIGGILTYKYIK